MRSLDATLGVPRPHVGVATGSSSFASCPCAGLPVWIARELAALAFAHIPVTAAWRHRVSATLPSSLHRSAPAQPPAEGTEGAAPGGGPPGPPPNMTSNRRLQQTQAQVEEVGGQLFLGFQNTEASCLYFLFFLRILLVARGSGRQSAPQSCSGPDWWHRSFPRL